MLILTYANSLRLNFYQFSQRVLQASGKDPRQWEVQVFASDEVNAFALPGGKIGVYEGMFDVATTPDPNQRSVAETPSSSAPTTVTPAAMRRPAVGESGSICALSCSMRFPAESGRS